MFSIGFRLFVSLSPRSLPLSNRTTVMLCARSGQKHVKTHSLSALFRCLATFIGAFPFQSLSVRRHKQAHYETPLRSAASVPTKRSPPTRATHASVAGASSSSEAPSLKRSTLYPTTVKRQTKYQHDTESRVTDVPVFMNVKTQSESHGGSG